MYNYSNIDVRVQEIIVKAVRELFRNKSEAWQYLLKNGLDIDKNIFDTVWEEYSKEINRQHRDTRIKFMSDKYE